METKQIQPSTTESNGRLSNGRFATGNTAGRGNPHAKRVAEIRSLLLKAITDKDLRGVIQALVKKARGGDVAAAKELFDRCLGKPQQAIEIDANVDQKTTLPPDFMRYLDWLAQQDGDVK